MQLKLPAGFRPDETMQLRLSDLEIPEASEIPEGRRNRSGTGAARPTARPSTAVSPASPQSSAPASPLSPPASPRP